MRLERIVLATDFSATARAALDRAVALAARFGARLYLFHVVDVRGGAGDPLDGGSKADEFYELAERRARDELALLRDAGGSLPIVECVRVGAPADEVVKLAEEKRADLVVVGTHGRQGIRRLLVGSVAESVVRRAPCPVLAVRVPDVAAATPLPTDPPPSTFDTIVCAVDSSASSHAALRAACEVARRFESRIVAVNVVDDYLMAQAGMLSQLDAVSIEERFIEIARANLERCLAAAAEHGCGRAVERRIEAGSPAEAIARVALTEHAQLVACGTHGRSGIARALFGSVAEQVVRLAPCPVLTVREGAPAARLAA